VDPSFLILAVSISLAIFLLRWKLDHKPVRDAFERASAYLLAWALLTFVFGQASAALGDFRLTAQVGVLVLLGLVLCVDLIRSHRRSSTAG